MQQPAVYRVTVGLYGFKSGMKNKARGVNWPQHPDSDSETNEGLVRDDDCFPYESDSQTQTLWQTPSFGRQLAHARSAIA